MNSDAPTQPLCQGPTILKTTDRLRLPPSLLVQDAAQRTVVQDASPSPAFGGLSSTEAGVATRLAPTPLLAEGLTDHHFLDCLERNALGELWKVRTPQGRTRLAHLLHRSDTAAGEKWLRQLTAVSHAALPPLDHFRTPSGQVVLMIDAPEMTFADWFVVCRAEGQQGVPREDLLLALRPIAEALDLLFLEHRLQHLGVHPGKLLLKDGQAQLHGFGLIPLLGPASGEPLAALNPYYAAPELFTGRPGAASDQYSLALIYAELLTGVHPLRGSPGALRPSSAKRQGKPELSLLANADRKVIARALDPDARLRFSSCRTLLRALEILSPADDPLLEEPPERMPSLIVASAPIGVRDQGSGIRGQGRQEPLLSSLTPDPRSLTPGQGGVSSLEEFIRQLLALAAGSLGVREYHTIRYRLEPGESLRHHCAVSLFPGAAVLKLEGFRQEWNAEAVLRERELFIFAVSLSPNLWQRLAGKQVGLELQVRLSPPARPGKALSEVSVVIRPFGCGRTQAVRLLAEMGPVLLESLRVHLQACPEQRSQERLEWNQPLRIVPVVTGLKMAEPIECLGKDVSPRGIGFFLPKPLAATHVYVNHPALPELATVAALAKVVRGQRGPDGWYEVGAQFAPSSKLG